MTAATGPMRCPTCGTLYTDGSRFCTRDGARLVEAALGRVPAPAQGAPGGRVLSAQSPSAASREPTAESPAPRAPGLTAGQTLDGRYRVARKVGEGGMSLVYLAHDAATGERVAIKVLSPALARDASAMARLRREAGLAGRLAHPNVCHILRMGETADGLPYVVMPFIEGEVLSEREHRLGTLPLDEAVRFARDIAEGLHVAHQLSIVHRDLKPENVMIVGEPSGAERAVVMDFGLAKERRAGRELEKLTATGIIMGTPEFMSPEQLRGKPLDARTDVYALALVTFEMLTGKLPFAGKTQQEMMIARLRSTPIPLRRMRPELDHPAVEGVLLKGMERDPGARYQTALEFAAALERAATGGEPSSPQRKSAIGKLFGK